jgi:hypothetical protein
MHLIARFPSVARRLQIPGMAAIALFSVAAFAYSQDNVLRWHDSLDRAAQAARTTGKPLFVVFRCVR